MQTATDPQLESEPRVNSGFKHSIPYRVFSDAVENLRDHFHPLHYEDLQKSGLKDSTIGDAGIFSVPPDRIASIVKVNLPQVISALAFPYVGIDFVRIKVFPPFIDKNGHKVKYLQPPRSGVHAYFPPKFWNHVYDPSRKIFITEGEKKALAGYQAGLCCIGLGGIWMWREKGAAGLIPELREIPFHDRVVEVVPDSDVMSNPSVWNGTAGLCRELEKLGARVKVRLLGEKQ